MSQPPHGGTEPPQPPPGGWEPDGQRTAPPWPPAPDAAPAAGGPPADPGTPVERPAGQWPTGPAGSGEPAAGSPGPDHDAVAEPATERLRPDSDPPGAASGGAPTGEPPPGPASFAAPGAGSGPGGDPVPPAGTGPGGPTRPRRRGAVIAAVVLALVLLLCGGGGLSAYLLLRDTEPTRGAPDPATAVDGFLNAVYSEQDPQQAAALVCSEARKGDRIAKKVDEVKAYGQKYKSPAFRWDKPKVEQEAAERATVSATVDMTTADEKTAEQKLTFTVLKKENGWRVCEVAG